MEVCLGAVEKPNDRRVDVPGFIRSQSPDSDLRLGWVNAVTGTAPTVTTNQLVPGRGRCEDLPETLSEDGESPGGDMAIFLGGDHLPDGLDFHRGEPMR